MEHSLYMLNEYHIQNECENIDIFEALEELEKLWALHLEKKIIKYKDLSLGTVYIAKHPKLVNDNLVSEVKKCKQ